MSSRADKKNTGKKNMIPREVEATEEVRTTTAEVPRKPEGESGKSEFDRVLEAIKASEDRMKESMETSFSEVRNTLGACGTRLDRHRSDINDLDRRVRILEGARPAPVKEPAPVEEYEPKPAPVEEYEPKPALKPSTIPMNQPGASLPIERRVIEPEEARLIPGCPIDARYEAAYWVCYVQHIVNNENVERSFIMRDKTSAIQKHNAASKRPHRVYVWLNADGEYLGKLNADALLYLHGV